MMKLFEDPQKMESAFDRALVSGPSMDEDLFLDFFQENFSDRKGMKQDFTPPELSELADGLSGQVETVVDICAGSGSMTVKKWISNKTAKFYCFELSKVALPFLLFNLAIRDINATVVHMDVLTRDCIAVYELKPSGRYSSITRCESKPPAVCADAVIMNPPFSVKWSGELDERTEMFAEPPKAHADYLFVLDGLAKLKDGGTLVAILPHGVLFRGSSEKTIREKLIQANLLDAVIGLPPKLFLNTGIPVCVLVIRKNRPDRDILFVDASKEFEARGRQNVLGAEDAGKILDVFKGRRTVEKYSRCVPIPEIAENEYNLNIPRYVDNFESDPIPDAIEEINGLIENDKEIRKLEGELAKMLRELYGKTPEKEKEIRKIEAQYNRYREHGRASDLQIKMPI